ncbi:MAG: PEP-CTERM sorting domain-containing protein [Planctomycetota bacterium]
MNRIPQTRKAAAFGAFLLFLIPASSAWSGLLVNGDFEAGNTGFNSNYNFTLNHPPVTGIYGVVSNPQSWFGNMGSFGDHTSGTGLMLVGDGGPVADNLLLEYQVPLVAGTTYQFTGYFAEGGGGESVSQQLFDVRLNGASIASLDLTGSAVGDWQELSGSYTAAASDPAGLLTIHALRTDPIGNNFAIDDLQFSAVPEPSSLSIFGIGYLYLLRRRRNA